MYTEEARSNSGQIIRKTLIRMYPGTLVYATMLGFLYMVDNIIAGNAMGPEAIAAVAIASPSYAVATDYTAYLQTYLL